ncbi:putative Histidine kinase [Burkholderiales bacterium GJ-E10]|nr:putative Histidine kinase [Burkholderiales bacterium GJ-E10]
MGACRALQQQHNITLNLLNQIGGVCSPVVVNSVRQQEQSQQGYLSNPQGVCALNPGMTYKPLPPTYVPSPQTSAYRNQLHSLPNPQTLSSEQIRREYPSSPPVSGPCCGGVR